MKHLVPIHVANYVGSPGSVQPGFKKFYLKNGYFKLYDGTNENDLVLDRPLDGFTPLIGTVTAADSVLTALEKLQNAISSFTSTVGPGTPNRVTKFLTSTTIADSLIEDNTSSVIINRPIGYTTPFTFDVNGTIRCDYGINNVANVPSTLYVNMPFYNLAGGTPDAVIVKINGKALPANGTMTGYNLSVSGPDNVGFYGDFDDTSGFSKGIQLISRPLHLGDFVNFNKYTGVISNTVFRVNNTGDTTANSFVKIGGTNLQYLMADGSVSTGPSITGYVPYVGATTTVNLNSQNLQTTGKILVGTATDPGSGTKLVVGNGHIIIDNNTHFLSKRSDGFLLSVFKVNTSNQLEFNPLFGQSLTDYLFTFNGTERMRITQAGNVGIGTTGPSQKLHVDGNARITGAIYDSFNSPGTSGQVLSSTGTGTTWIATPAPTPAALTKIDDTNVTLTLGGTPSTALLQNVSLTLGWTGTLADGRIASAATWNAKQNALSGTGIVKSTAGVISYINGTTAEYVRGDGTLATFPTIPGGTVTGVTATSPITSSGGTAPNISTSMNTNKLIGRSTAGVGVMEEITIGTGLSLSGGTLSASSTGGIPHATASGTDTYTATVTGVTSYADGDAYLIRFTNGNTTGATLNINGLGAITLYRNNDGALIGGDIINDGEMLCVYNSTTNVFQCIGTAPNTLLSYVTNADSVTLTKGMAVYAFGGTGDRMTVKRALNTGDSTSAQTVGLVLSASIAVNQKGLIMMQGLLDGLSILPTSTFVDGDPVYLGATAGSITNVKPYAPNHLVYLGVVTTASPGASGRMYVRVQNGYELDELHNVQAQSPALKDTLWYDNTVSPAQWKTASIPTILGYTPFQLPSLTNGSVLFSNGTTIAQDNSNFFWNNSTKRLGINTNSPSAALHVAGNMYLQNPSGIDTITFSNGPQIEANGPSGYFKSGQVYTNTLSNFVGIATSSPTTELDVNGVITATGGNSTSWNAKQDAITLTTTGTSGPATLVGATLNIPQYSGGGGGGSTPVKLTSQTLTAASWTLSGGYYTYAFSNVNIDTTCDVSVTPQNASYLTAYNAQVLPFIGVAAGVATFYSQFPPQADMIVDIVITQTT